MEISLAVLMGLLAVRMTSLAKTGWPTALPASSADGCPPRVAPELNPHTPPPTSGFGVRLSEPQLVGAPDRTELITQLHILLSLQEKVCREDGLVIETLPDVVKNYAVAWTYGAASSLVGVSTRHSAEVIDLTARLVAKKIGYKQSAAVQAIATLTKCSSMLACYRNGLESADYWLQHHHVPAETALNRSISSNAFI
ncbi:hypothetical protein [Marinobacter sp. SS21]|uniref:hypothetical protein n=1 Tax=Marinobacter sp. SS21 TaxID=2979460 RepID=UPI00232D9A2C|nr:hypothetical protein [Marinobacter sp. SS21]MDC0664310.1 hypothetical protein [Marinobacter sp. SS21]